MSAERGPGSRGRLARLSGELAALSSNPAIRGIASVFVLKVSIIVLNFALIMLAARVLDPDHFGTFSILFSAVGLFCIVATFGQQVSVMRSWNEYMSPRAIPRCLRARCASAWRPA